LAHLGVRLWASINEREEREKRGEKNEKREEDR
jgi:hypothetical protein